MVEILIFHFHLIGALYAFTKNWQTRRLVDAFLALAVIGLLFAIGWAITGTLAYYIWPKQWNSIYFSSDTLSLVLLFIPECYFFYIFFVKDRAKHDTPASDME